MSAHDGDAKSSAHDRSSSIDFSRQTPKSLNQSSEFESSQASSYRGKNRLIDVQSASSISNDKPQVDRMNSLIESVNARESSAFSNKSNSAKDLGEMSK